MTNLEQCKSVLADLEKASGADRDLEIRIATTIDGWALEKRGKDRKTWLYKDSDKFGYHRCDPSPYGYGHYPRLTHSLDATIALVERVLPNSVIDLCVFTGTTGRSSASICRSDADWPYEGGASEVGSTPPLALLTAMFRALIAQMEKAG